MVCICSHEVDLGPENAMFRKFHEIWSDIDKEAQIKLMDVDEDLKKELICFYTALISSSKRVRPRNCLSVGII